MILTCKNKICKYEWDYKGKSKFYVTCPQCYNKLKIKEELHPSEEPEGDAFNNQSKNEN